MVRQLVKEGPLASERRLYFDKLFVGISEFLVTPSGGARGHPDRGSSFPDRGAEVSACSTLPCKLPLHIGYCEVEAQLTSCMHISRN